MAGGSENSSVSTYNIGIIDKSTDVFLQKPLCGHKPAEVRDRKQSSIGTMERNVEKEGEQAAVALQHFT